MKFPAWTYNGQVPRSHDSRDTGDLLRVHFVNTSARPYGLHFHGWHHPDMDGSLAQHQVMPGKDFAAGSSPIRSGCTCAHYHGPVEDATFTRGSTGTFIIDPKGADPTPRDEFVMMMNAFDTNFDNQNNVPQ